jgi:SAM-dependent methyltransferase
VSAFEGRFGAAAAAYRGFRPRWPAEVLERVLARVPAPRRRAVDLGAGTGLVTHALVGRFDEVVAVEPDARMLAELAPAVGLRPWVARAEDAHFELGSVDLVTAGNAFHWFEGERVCAVAHTWLRSGGLLAVFRYEPPHAARGELRELLAHEYEHVWRAHVHARLGDPDYTRRTLAASAFGPTLEERWLPNDLALTPADLLGFLRSTSYAGGHARSLPAPEAYWRDLAARIHATAGDGPYLLDFRVQLLLAARP